MAGRIDSVTSMVLRQGSKTINNDSAEAYERLDLQIRTLEAMARETFQYQFRQDYQTVVDKLENEEILDEEDKQLLAQLVIADAKAYVKQAKDYETWKDQIDRMLTELRQLQEKGVRTSDDLLHIQAICRDLRGVLPDITYFLRERERIRSFEQNDIQSLSPELKKFLAEIIKAMMESSKM
jgi:hypothetical protein